MLQQLFRKMLRSWERLFLVCHPERSTRPFLVCHPERRAQRGVEGPLSPRTILPLLVPLVIALTLTGCLVGPNYSRPPVVSPPSYKETQTPSNTKLPANWWEIFNDPQLNALEVQVDTANQTLKQSEANFVQARAMIRYQRSNYYPTVGVAPTGSRNKVSSNRPALDNIAGQDLYRPHPPARRLLRTRHLGPGTTQR